MTKNFFVNSATAAVAAAMALSSPAAQAQTSARMFCHGELGDGEAVISNNFVTHNNLSVSAASAMFKDNIVNRYNKVPMTIYCFPSNTERESNSKRDGIISYYENQRMRIKHIVVHVFL